MPQKKTPGKQTTESPKLKASETKSPRPPARTRTLKAPPAPNGNEHLPTHEEIAAKAYALWESRGKPDGSPQEDWFRARQELSG